MDVVWLKRTTNKKLEHIRFWGLICFFSCIIIKRSINVSRKNKIQKMDYPRKNGIVLLYLDGHMGRTEILKRFSISNDGVLHKWIKQ